MSLADCAVLCRQASWDQQQQQLGLESVRGGAASYLLLVGCRQRCTACGIFVPQRGMDLGSPPAVETRSPNHRTTWEFPQICFLMSTSILKIVFLNICF